MLTANFGDGTLDARGGADGGVGIDGHVTLPLASTAIADTDDNGILLSADDNSQLAARLLDDALATFALDCR